MTTPRKPTATDTAPPQREVWIDGLRLTAGLSMLGLHASADIHGQPFADADAAARFWPLMLRTLFYCARTELFVMVSVLLLMLSLQTRPRSYATTLREQARRLLPAFLFWTVFFSLYSLIKAWHLGYLNAAWAQLFAPQQWLSHLILGTAKYHMHFIPTLFALLLFYPIFQLGVARPWLLIGAIVGLLAKWSLDSFAYPMFWGDPALPYIIRAIKVVSYIGYGLAAASIAGLWIRHSAALYRQTPTWLIAPLLIIGLILITIKMHTMLAVVQEGQWVFHNLPSFWADFLMPVVLLLLAMSCASYRWPARLSHWARYSLGLYLCHPIFLDLAEITLPTHLPPLALVLLKILITLPLTLLLLRWLETQRLCAWTVGLGPLPWSNRARDDRQQAPHRPQRPFKETPSC